MSTPGKRPWHLVLRSLHLITSLVMAALLAFYAVTGFIGNRASWFQAEEVPIPPLTVPAGIALDDAGLGPWAAGALGLGAPVAPWTRTGDKLAATATDGRTGDTLALSVDATSRQAEVVRWHALPAGLDLGKEPLTAYLRATLGGDPDEKNAEDDATHLRIDLESVWGTRSVTVDRPGRRWQATTTAIAWPTALVDLHRGKHAGPVQRLVIDATALVLLLLVGSGIGIGWSLVKKRRLVTALTLASVALLFLVLIGR